MSKQIYIDSNGNEIQVSGTVNTADMMPMSASDSRKVSEAIGDLSDLTTTVKSSLVGAVNEVDTIPRIKQDTISGTTNSSGLIAFDHTKRVIVGFIGNSNKVIFQIPYFVCVKNYDTLTPYEGSVSIPYWYIDV